MATRHNWYFLTEVANGTIIIIFQFLSTSIGQTCTHIYIKYIKLSTPNHNMIKDAGSVAHDPILSSVVRATEDNG